MSELYRPEMHRGIRVINGTVHLRSHHPDVALSQDEAYEIRWSDDRSAHDAAHHQDDISGVPLHTHERVYEVTIPRLTQIDSHAGPNSLAHPNILEEAEAIGIPTDLPLGTIHIFVHSNQETGVFDFSRVSGKKDLAHVHNRQIELPHQVIPTILIARSLPLRKP